MGAAASGLSAGTIDRERAASLEADAAEFPEQRGMFLLEAARAWRAAGEVARAAELLDEQVADGGDDGCYARVQRAELVRRHGQACRSVSTVAGDSGPRWCSVQSGSARGKGSVPIR